MSELDEEKFLQKLQDFLLETLEEPEHVEEANQFLKDLQAKIAETKRLSISSLYVLDVVDIFGLYPDNDDKGFWDLKEEELLDIPESMLDSVGKVERILRRGFNDEDASRLRLDAILMGAITAEQQVVNDSPSGNPVFIAFNTNMTLDVNWRNEARLLTGQADYSILYGDNAMTTHLIVFVSRDCRKVPQCTSKCLAYMAMVNSKRRENGYQNTVVYGCATDGYFFTFL